MSVAVAPAQAETYWRLLERVENAVDSPLDLGGLKQEITAADLDEDDRLDLLGRCDTYLADIDAANDPVEQGARGNAPVIDGELTVHLGSALDDPEDAALDVADGFAPVGWEPPQLDAGGQAELAEAKGHPFGQSKYEYATQEERDALWARFPSYAPDPPKKGGAVALYRDKDGLFVCTHRARSKSFPSVARIPKSVVIEIERTG